MSERHNIICNIICIIDLISDEEMCPIPKFDEDDEFPDGKVTNICPLFSVSHGSVSFPSSSRLLSFSGDGSGSALFEEEKV